MAFSIPLLCDFKYSLYADNLQILSPGLISVRSSWTSSVSSSSGLVVVSGSSLVGGRHVVFVPDSLLFYWICIRDGGSKALYPDLSVVIDDGYQHGLPAWGSSHS